MQEMPKIPGLQRRRLTYYIRVRVPQELVSVYKSKEVVRSLETRDYETACKRIHKQRAIIQSEFDEKLHQIKAAAKNPDMLSGYSAHDLEGLTLRWMAELQKRAKVKKSSKPSDPENCSEPDDEEDVISNLEQEAALYRREKLGLQDSDLHYGMNAAAKFLKSRGVTFDWNSPNFKELGDLFSEALHADVQHSLQQWKGLPHAPASPLYARFISGEVQDVALSGKIKKKVTVKELFDAYMKDPSRTRGPSTQKNYQIILRALEEHLGSQTYVHDNEMKEGRLQANKCGRQTLISQENFRKWVEGFSRY